MLPTEHTKTIVRPIIKLIIITMTTILTRLYYGNSSRPKTESFARRLAKI